METYVYRMFTLLQNFLEWNPGLDLLFVIGLLLFLNQNRFFLQFLGYNNDKNN
jgi:hypothetical protein